MKTSLAQSMSDTCSLSFQMGEIIQLWDNLLKKLSSHQVHFLPMLTDEMVIHLTSPSNMDIKTDVYRRTIYMWLEHIYATKAWAAVIRRRKLNIKNIILPCLENPNYWTILLASAVTEATDRKDIKEIFRELIAQARALEVQPKDPVAETVLSTAPNCPFPSFSSQPNSSQIEEEIKGHTPHVYRDRESRLVPVVDPEIGGWMKWSSAWIPKPIGTI